MTTEFSPPIEISTVKIEKRKARVHVVREDLLPGGTKQRAVIPFLNDLRADGYNEFVYSSPFCGFAQVALAYAGNALDERVTLFCETMPSKPDQFHPLSLQAQELGARIFPCVNLMHAEEEAAVYTRSRQTAFHLPLGFNHPLFVKHYAAALAEQFDILVSKLGFLPKTLWLPVGSGTLTRLFREVLPEEVKLNCVDVQVLAKSDPRIESVRRLENVSYYSSPLKFQDESEDLPPVPSNVYYDAKLWSFLNQHAGENDVWWNVAK